MKNRRKPKKLPPRFVRPAYVTNTIVPGTKLDPTRTGALRRTFSTAVGKQFAYFAMEVTRFVVSEDVFGVGDGGEPSTVLNTAREFASTQVNLVDPDVLDGWRAIQSSLEPDDVLKLEDDPHITVRFGLHDLPGVADSARDIVAGFGPIRASINGLSLFENGEADVLKFSVSSPDLHELNDRLGTLPNTSTHPVYSPHFTVAYLKKGTGLKYVRPTHIDYTPVEFGGVVYSAVDKSTAGMPTINAFCPTGPGGGVNPTCSPRKEHALKKGIERLSREVMRQLGAAGKWLMSQTKVIYKNLEGRYGKKTALAIFLSGQTLSWGAFLGGAAAGSVVYVPSAVAMAPGAAIAEMRRRVLRKRKGVTANVETPEFIEELGRRLVDDITRIWESRPAEFTTNVFCPTGEGGGVDPTCSTGGEGQLTKTDGKSLAQEIQDTFPDGPRRQHARSAAVSDSPKWFDVHALRDADGRLVAVASIWKDPDTASPGIPSGRYLRIGNLGAIGGGAGRTMVNHLKKLAREKGAGLELTDIESSREFWRKMGFHSGENAGTWYLPAEQLATNALFGLFKKTAKAAVAAGAIAGGDNCGIGAGGFLPGNTCARGGGAEKEAPKARTDSPEFRHWFGSSKVVDAAGNPKETAEADLKTNHATGAPLVVFHGNPRGEVTEFKKEWTTKRPESLHFGPGFYFTEDVEAARQYAAGATGSSAKGAAAVGSYYLKAVKPFDADRDKIDPSRLNETDRKSVRAAIVSKVLGDEGRSEALDAGRRFDAGEYRLSYNELTSTAGVGGYGASKVGVQRLLTEMGHDAITVQGPDAEGGKPGGNRFWVVFEPTQIKSTRATKFDPTDPVTIHSETIVENVFCATGSGGGVDPTCKLGDRASVESHFDTKHKVSISGPKLSDASFANAAGHISDELDRLASMKAVKDTLKKRIPGQFLRIGEIYSGREGKTAGKYTYTMGIELDPTLSGPPDPNAKSVLGSHTVSTDLLGTFRHEFGHDVYNVGLTRGKQAEWNKKFSKYVGTNTISRYGGTNTSELFSEAFSVYAAKSYSRGFLPKDIEDWMDKNVRGSKSPTANELTDNQRWKFKTSDEKVEEFRQWLKTQIQARLTGRPGRALWEEYVKQGYNKGAGRAYDDATRRKRATGRKPQETKAAREEFIATSLGSPTTVEKVKLLVGRTFTELEGVTEQMATNMTRVLADGLVQRLGVRQIGKNLAEEVNITRKRADRIARTEIVRAHAEGQLDAMERMGVENVGAAVEWETTRGGVCPRCASMRGVVLKISEARGLIPLHPHCRCAWVPNIGIKAKGLKRSKSSIDAALKAADVEDVAISKDRPALNFLPIPDDVKPALNQLGAYLANFDPSQPRDERGRFSASGVGGVSKPAADLLAGLGVPKRLLDVLSKDEIAEYRRMASVRAKLLNKLKLKTITDHERSLMDKYGRAMDDLVLIGDNRLKEKKAREKGLPSGATQFVIDSSAARAASDETQRHVAEVRDKMARHDSELSAVRQAVLDVDAKLDVLFQDWNGDRMKLAGMSHLPPDQIDKSLLESVDRKMGAYRDYLEKSKQEAFDAIKRSALPGAVDHYPRIGQYFTSEQESTIQSMAAKLSGVLHPEHDKALRSNTYMKIPPHEAQRSYYQSISMSINLADHQVTEGTAAHELGHALEGNPKVFALSNGFLHHRVGSETARHMGEGYGPTEVGREDKFSVMAPGTPAYVGKHYVSRDTEILSSGMEALVNNPARFARADPEYFKFVVGVLNGRLLE